MLIAMPLPASHAGEGRASELRTLVGIEDLRLAVTSQSILQRLDAERSFTLKSIQQMMGRPTPITWNHRVLLTEEQGEKSYCIHEVHYDEDGSVMGWTQNAIAVFVPSFAELIFPLPCSFPSFAIADSISPAVRTCATSTSTDGRGAALNER